MWAVTLGRMLLSDFKNVDYRFTMARIREGVFKKLITDSFLFHMIRISNMYRLHLQKCKILIP